MPREIERERIRGSALSCRVVRVREHWGVGGVDWGGCALLAAEVDFGFEIGA